MNTLLTALLAVLALGAPTYASCSADCGGDGGVSGSDLGMGIRIVLGAGSVGECSSLNTTADAQITIEELVLAVRQVDQWCLLNVVGDYSSSLTLDPGHYGIVNLNVNGTNQISGSLLLTTSEPHRASRAPELSFNFPVGGVSVALSGTLDPAVGFEVEGSFVDGSGQTIPVVISGSIAGLNGSEMVNLYVGADTFPITLGPGIFATPSATPTPTPPPVGGAPIVYAVGTEGLYVINRDGTGKTRIFDQNVGIVSGPAWSPDGNRIAFSKADDENHYVLIATVNADGGNLREFPDQAFIDRDPAWSPDGNKIIFTAGGGDHIDVMNADGSGRHRVVAKQEGESYGHLSWSPDGSRVVFESTRPRQSGSQNRVEIWVMNADGSNLVRLTTNELPDRHPDWSPNGQKIVFERANSFQGGIMSINPDGTGEVRLIFDSFNATAPSWSFDGQSLAYTSLFGVKVTNSAGAMAMAVPNTMGITDFDYK